MSCCSLCLSRIPYYDGHVVLKCRIKDGDDNNVNNNETVTGNLRTLKVWSDAFSLKECLQIMEVGHI